MEKDIYYIFSNIYIYSQISHNNKNGNNNKHLYIVCRALSQTVFDFIFTKT